ncbi:D-beta-hydroxybutyrate dehydrogenase, mitochondrial-like [Eubalaena glacialis]|uniref:D-beta-hydroxybutyrate dehydrogenase, mitochondrial-like n=1 Tax=Eubalaena glacialis TaxID=27606 RepID=UPI002A5A47BE|nr:D-beta-hydroxybutyrate dehydrogenase, mitochondrial-like [Eubalaena glacialis]
MLEPTRRSLTILPLVATMLTARFSRPLSQLPRKTLNFSDRVNGARGSLLFHSASFVPVDCQTYAASVNPALTLDLGSPWPSICIQKASLYLLAT